MTLSHTPGIIKRFRRTPWKLQHTFHTPLQNLTSFVSSIISSVEPLRSGSVTIASVIFDDPVELRILSPLLANYGTRSPVFHPDWSIEANGADELQAILQAAFSDFINFIFVPNPSPFSLYADHDEYTTFFAHTRSNLNRVVAPLIKTGFKAIDCRRTL
jgi:hypothetical protein